MNEPWTRWEGWTMVVAGVLAALGADRGDRHHQDVRSRLNTEASPLVGAGRRASGAGTPCQVGLGRRRYPVATLGVAQTLVMWVWGAPIACSINPDAGHARNGTDKPARAGSTTSIEKETSR